MEQKYIGNQTPIVVKNLLVVNVLIYVASVALVSKGINMDSMLSLHPPQSPLFRPWQIITHMFMHANFTHLFFNMFGLWMFGRILEMVWGPKRFLFFYIITGLSAAALNYGVETYRIAEIIKTLPPNIGDISALYGGYSRGASGALFGILGGCLILFPNTELILLFPPIPIKLKYAVTFYGLYELYSGISNNPGDNVAHFAHLGGLIAGIIIVKYWNRNKRDTFY